METTLHRQLKQLYAGEGAQTEVRLGRFRIDAVADGELIEIQHGSLAAIRDKVRRLLAKHRVRVVKPVVGRKTILRCGQRGGPVLSRRKSPKTGALLDLFHELVYFTGVFPHRRLVLEAPLVDVDEWRYPGHGKRRRWRRDDHVVEDQRLVEIRQVRRLAVPSDLVDLLGIDLPATFHTGDLAERLNVPRWVAQRVAYCLRKTGAVTEAGRARQGIVYALPEAA